MLGLIMRLIAWDFTRKRARLGLMIMTIFATLTTYIVFGAILDDVATRAMQMWRTEAPYDITVRGPNVSSFTENIRTFRGVVQVHEVETVEVIIGSSQLSILALGSNSLYVLEFVEGGAPTQVDHMAIPVTWATSIGLTIGTTLRILAIEPGAEARTFTICGFMADKSRVPQQALILPEAALILGSGVSRKTTLLVALDGKVKIAGVKNDIQLLSRNLDVVGADDQYSGVQGGMGFADVLLSTMRGLVLVVAAAVMGALTHLAQRERAYQNGVLRAMGLARGWLLVAPMVEGLAVFALGGSLAFLLLPLIAKPLGLLAGSQSIVSLFWSQAGIFMGLGLGFVAVSALTLAYRPITSLLRDAWGK